jgi:hypothetical protein
VPGDVVGDVADARDTDGAERTRVVAAGVRRRQRGTNVPATAVAVARPRSRSTNGIVSGNASIGPSNSTVIAPAESVTRSGPTRSDA